MRPKTSLIPSPEQLAAYQHVDPQLPARIIEVANSSDERNYKYAMTALIGGWTAFIFAVLTSAYIIMHDHPVAGTVLGGGVVSSIVIAMIRARLPSEDKDEKPQ